MFRKMSKFWFFKVKIWIFGYSGQNVQFLDNTICQNFGFMVKILVFQGQNFDFWLFRSKCSVIRFKNVSKCWFQGQNNGFQFKLFQF